MTTFANGRAATSTRPLTIEELAARPPEPATQEMPPEIRDLLRPDSGVYIRSKKQPTIELATEKVAEGIWRVVGAAEGVDGELLTAIPGREATELNFEDHAPVAEPLSTKGYRPPWVSAEYVPDLEPFRADGNLVYGLRAIETPDRLSYPFRTIGFVENSLGKRGSGVLVGPNLLLTAGHCIPWGQSSWSMKFTPAHREGTTPPFGSSFVETYRGYNVGSNAPTGHDYAICKLYTPLGQGLGWMGTQSFGDEDDYYRHRYTSSGYPTLFGERPAVQFDMGVRDIDNDNPGKEIEFSFDGFPHIRGGWSGGPLWFDQATITGVVSGAEKDGLDPKFIVVAGGSAMVDLVKFGLANWRP